MVREVTMRAGSSWITFAGACFALGVLVSAAMASAATPAREPPVEVAAESASAVVEARARPTIQVDAITHDAEALEREGHGRRAVELLESALWHAPDGESRSVLIAARDAVIRRRDRLDVVEAPEPRGLSFVEIQAEELDDR
jgi:hypothetical protein